MYIPLLNFFGFYTQSQKDEIYRRFNPLYAKVVSANSLEEAEQVFLDMLIDYSKYRFLKEQIEYAEWALRVIQDGGIYENKKSSRPFAIDYDLQCTKRGDVKSRWL